ncbi:MAG: hypothetical protein WCJ09_15905 [Planctomycetota bacterium]
MTRTFSRSPNDLSLTGWRSMAVAAAMILSQTLPASMFAQSEFMDANSHVPPSPGNYSPGIYDSPNRSVGVTVGRPTPGVTSPPQAVAGKVPPFAYDHARRRNMPQVPARAAVPNEVRPGSTVARSTSSSLLNPFGIGKKNETTTDAPRTVSPLGHIPITGNVSKASYNQLEDPSQGFPPPDPLPGVPGPSLIPHRQPVVSGGNFPTDRGGPPMILGNHLRLSPGETATERSMRLMTTIGEMERQLDALGQQSAEQNQLLKHRDDQLLLAIREIRSARKEVATAKDELERLRQQVQLLQDKVRDAERDNAALLQTMAPLLQRLLESDGTSGLPDESEE